MGGKGGPGKRLHHCRRGIRTQSHRSHCKRPTRAVGKDRSTEGHRQRRGTDAPNQGTHRQGNSQGHAVPDSRYPLQPQCGLYPDDPRILRPLFRDLQSRRHPARRGRGDLPGPCFLCIPVPSDQLRRTAVNPLFHCPLCRRSVGHQSRRSRHWRDRRHDTRFSHAD